MAKIALTDWRRAKPKSKQKWTFKDAVIGSLELAVFFGLFDEGVVGKRRVTVTKIDS